MKLFIASDHAGLELKESLRKITKLGAHSIEWVDLGPANADSVDYPDYAGKVCREILKTNPSKQELQKPRGVLICGSGVGMSIAANRFAGIRAVLAFQPEVASVSRRHNATNVLCLGERFVKESEAREILEAWLTNDFEGGRHERRVDGIEAAGKGSC